LTKTDGPTYDSVRKTKNTVGIIAIVLLMLFTVLALIGVISSTVWIIADLIVAVVANVIFRVIGRHRKL
jgi:hypothetical protein